MSHRGREEIKSAAKRLPLTPYKSIPRVPAHGHTAFNAKYFPGRKEVIQMASPDDGGTPGPIPTETEEKYFVMGKNLIKITEHFPPDGKQLGELIADLVIQKIKENAGKSA